MTVILIILAVAALAAGAFAFVKNSIEAAALGVVCLAIIVLIGQIGH